jgi:hypothetical protein
VAGPSPGVLAGSPLYQTLPPAIPGVGALRGRAFPLVFAKGSKLCDGISSTVFSYYPREKTK